MGEAGARSGGGELGGDFWLLGPARDVVAGGCVWVLRGGAGEEGLAGGGRGARHITWVWRRSQKSGNDLIRVLCVLFVCRGQFRDSEGVKWERLIMASGVDVSVWLRLADNTCLGGKVIKVDQHRGPPLWPAVNYSCPDYCSTSLPVRYKTKTLQSIYFQKFNQISAPYRQMLVVRV